MRHYPYKIEGVGSIPTGCTIIMKQCLACNKRLEGIVDLPQWRIKRVENNKYCSKKCQQRFQSLVKLEKWKSGEWDGLQYEVAVSSTIRNYLHEKYNNKCSRCGWNTINPYTKKVPLQIEHIDGDYRNNKENNLTLICPNCHSLTPTWGGRNKGKGRPRVIKRSP